MFGFHGFGKLPFARIALVSGAGGSSGVRRAAARLFTRNEEKRVEILKEREVEIVATRRVYVEQHDATWKLLKELSETSAEYLKLNKELAALIEAINRLEQKEQKIKTYIRRSEIRAAEKVAKEAERVRFAEAEVKRKTIEEEEALLLLLSHA